MSTTISSSSSPTNSPRSSFHVSSPRPSFAPAQRSPATSRASPRFSSSSSAAGFNNTSAPRRAFNAPTAASGPQQPKQRFVESGPVAGSFAGYVDASTQYSPDGFPPTAGRNVAIAAGKGRPPGRSASSSARKRKEAQSSSDESSPEPMSGTKTHRSAARPPAPAEPQLRSDPDRVLISTNATAASSSSEPQEARSTHGHSAAPKKARPEGTVKQMPSEYETCSSKDLGVLISNMLMELIRINDQIPLRDGRLTRFHSRAPPGISVSDYLQRLIQHATLPPPILLSMVYYIDRLCTQYPAFTINSLTVHRFLITAATVAAKGLSDSFWTNPTYARIGGIPVSELATLELELLQRVDWKIVPKPEVLEEYYASLVDRTDGYTIEAASSSSSLGSGSDGGEGSNKDQQMGNAPT
ncbi:hypothetical protein DOTSEDRAFT_69255 [Dothistroma septosporum NZE10]|uniref:Cyclin-like domain-containing protein n=1 Tax=Dothistroma septosporum (strain NZE10 / CBS 128990) TaxID=675120 RepID=N1PYE8_DOTSN|nr:hypothetical protein DOTSEDRAFT_69255 [Dothistroma septosporum NZE10]